MVFSSAIFLFLFLPLVLAGHWLAGKRLRNLLLLVASLIFYAWGEGAYVLLMLCSIFLNTLFGRILEAGQTSPYKKWWLASMLGMNLLPLMYFKYSIFLIQNLNAMLLPEYSQLNVPEHIHLPIGISFFTFQAMSYLIDIYRHTSHERRSVLDVGVYIALFPQLIAGPIVRYHDISAQIRHRIQSVPLFASGIERFIFGLGKKMLIANPMGFIADTIFALPANEIGLATAWLGILCYALQIYFDFSGYSDMAIGLGRMLGFKFLENFNFPYISRSIREFWRRWHISLSNWFRDYLYIPLGGNRHGHVRTLINLLLVFLVTGLWHGASWNFVIWGLLHGCFLVLERGYWGRLLDKSPLIFQHSYMLLVVLSAWVFFRADTLDYSLSYLSSMYSPSTSMSVHPGVAVHLDLAFYCALIAGLALAAPLYPWLAGKSKQIVQSHRFTVSLAYITRLLLLSAIFYLSVLEIAIGSYNPFIYFRF